MIPSPLTYKQAITGNKSLKSDTSLHPRPSKKRIKSQAINLSLKFVEYCHISRISSITEITAIFGGLRLWLYRNIPSTVHILLT
jgi:hypothetical protein